MPKILLLIGLPGCGKSTYAKFLLTQENYVILSSDSLRKELLGNEEDQSKNIFVFKTLTDRMHKAMEEKRNIIIDATNITIKDRKQYLDAANQFGYQKEAVFINTPIEDCIKYDKQRERTVGGEVIHKFANKLQPPTLEEGFDSINTYNGLPSHITSSMQK